MASFDFTLHNSGISLQSVLQPAKNVRKTKIVCTMGPSCWSPEMVLKLIDAGMNVARLNFSHGDHQVHLTALRNIRKACEQRPEKHIAIMLDTKGPEIRTGMLEGGGPVKLEKGQLLEITTDYSALGNSKRISCSYLALPKSVEVGSRILVADGSFTMIVKEIQKTGVLVEVLSSGSLGERKNMNLPGIIVDLPTVTEKDKEDLVKFGVAQQVDFIAASFVRKPTDIDTIREVLGERGKDIRIIAKIENQEGLENFDAILEKTDGVMVARGDLGMEIPPEKVFLAQKMMIRKCNLAGKYVITATQMLESMISNPRPFRSECTDIANAVLDGSDCVMLSGETAAGKFPIEAVETMAAICREAEGAINYHKLHLATRNSVMKAYGNAPLSTPEAVASSTVKTCIDIRAKLIIVLTESGNSARLVAKYRPEVPVLCLTTWPVVARQSEGILRGVTSLVLGSVLGTDSVLLRAIEYAKEHKMVEAGDTVIAFHGQRETISGSSNMLKVLVAQ